MKTREVLEQYLNFIVAERPEGNNQRFASMPKRLQSLLSQTYDAVNPLVQNDVVRDHAEVFRDYALALYDAQAELRNRLGYTDDLRWRYSKEAGRWLNQA